MCCYYTIKEYIDSGKNTAERIKLIDQLIDKLILSMLDSVEGRDSSVEELQMNDGQMIVRTRYRSTSDIEEGIKGLERIKQMYINRLNGHVFLLRNKKGLR